MESYGEVISEMIQQLKTKICRMSPADSIRQSFVKQDRLFIKYCRTAGSMSRPSSSHLPAWAKEEKHSSVFIFFLKKKNRMMTRSLASRYWWHLSSFPTIRPMDFYLYRWPEDQEPSSVSTEASLYFRALGCSIPLHPAAGTMSLWVRRPDCRLRLTCHHHRELCAERPLFHVSKGAL